MRDVNRSRGIIPGLNPNPRKTFYYSTFSERPKHLDPVSAYSANEYVFLGQIYEPPLQYHFLKRPYQLVPLTSMELPVPVYFDARGNIVPADTPPDDITRVKYRIRIQPGIMYQPHPAFARDSRGEYRYHALSPKALQDIHALHDFEYLGTREMLANDYVYQIKRMAHPGVHTPIAGLMSKYILGLGEFAEMLAAEYGRGGDNKSTYIDLNEYELPGAVVIDDYTFEITLTQKYPQFLYWLSMPFFRADALGSSLFLFSGRDERQEYYTRLVSGGDGTFYAGGKQSKPAHGAGAQPELSWRGIP